MATAKAMMQRGMRSALLPLLLLSLLVCAATSARADEVTTVQGTISFVGREAVEVGGRRALVTNETSISSNGRAIALSSLQVGMPAELEIDSAGRALDLRVEGAVE